MKTVPYWSNGLARPEGLHTDSTWPGRVDVAVIGGGYTGLNAARILAQAGASVAVLEEHAIGWGASSRNGGMLTTGIKAPAPVMVKRYGLELGRAFWQASLDAIDLVERLVTEEAIACDFRRSGHVALAFKPAHFAAMEKKAAWFEETLGYSMRVVPARELGGEIGSRAYHGGLVDAYSAGLDPAKYVRGLAVAAARHGARLYEQAEVQAITQNGGEFRLSTSRGRLAASDVLVATNGYTGGLVPKLRPRTFAVGSYIIVTEPLPAELQARLSPRGRMFYDSKNFLNYFRLTPDGRMLFGGRNNLSTTLDLVESARRLQARMIEVFPALRGVPLTHSWTGQLGLTFDLMPHIGRIDGIHYALGYCGHGVSIATYLGTEAGQLLAGQKTSSPFMAIPHETRFFYRRRPWFLPLAAAYYRARDWLF